jgi:hypothetical protein
MAKITLTFTSQELMKIVYDHAMKNKLIPDGTYDGSCTIKQTGYSHLDGFDFNLYLKKVN